MADTFNLDLLAETASAIEEKRVAARSCLQISTRHLPRVLKGVRGFIGEYQILKKLGEGSFGEVYLAEKRGKKFVVKLMSDKKSYKQEKKTLCKLLGDSLNEGCNAKSQVCFIEDFRYDHHYVIVMSYLASMSLHDLYDEFVIFSPKDYLLLIYKLLVGLQAIHRKGIVHGDIKLENIIVQLTDYDKRVENVLYIDFGLACILGEGDRNRECKISGTDWWQAPEAAVNPEMSFRSAIKTDIYSLGVSLYLLFNNRFPNDIDRADYRDYTRIKHREAKSNFKGQHFLKINRIIDDMIKVDPIARASIEYLLAAYFS